jgi:hypothetical protein
MPGDSPLNLMCFNDKPSISDQRAVQFASPFLVLLRGH